MTRRAIDDTVRARALELHRMGKNRGQVQAILEAEGTKVSDGWLSGVFRSEPRQASPAARAGRHAPAAAPAPAPAPSVAPAPPGAPPAPLAPPAPATAPAPNLSPAAVVSELLNYAYHADACDAFDSPSTKVCTCGFDAVVRQTGSLIALLPADDLPDAETADLSALLRRSVTSLAGFAAVAGANNDVETLTKVQRAINQCVTLAKKFEPPTRPDVEAHPDMVAAAARARAKLQELLQKVQAAK